MKAYEVLRFRVIDDSRMNGYYLVLPSRGWQGLLLIFCRISPHLRRLLVAWFSAEIICLNWDEIRSLKSEKSTDFLTLRFEYQNTGGAFRTVTNLF